LRKLTSRWKYLGEKKMMVSSKRGWKMVEGRKNLIPHPLKGYLGVGCLTSGIRAGYNTRLDGPEVSLRTDIVRLEMSLFK
jgi:hypothetical protein